MTLFIKCKDFTTRKVNLHISSHFNEKGQVLTRARFEEIMATTAKELEGNNYYGHYIVYD